MHHRPFKPPSFINRPVTAPTSIEDERRRLARLAAERRAKAAAAIAAVTSSLSLGSSGAGDEVEEGEGKENLAVKRRKKEESDDDDDDCTVLSPATTRKLVNSQAQKFSVPAFIPTARDNAQSSDNAVQPTTSLGSSKPRYFKALWRKQTTRKNKTWDGDGVLRLTQTLCTLQDDSGKTLGKIRCNPATVFDTGILKFGSYEAEAEDQILEREVLSGRAFSSRAIEIIDDDEESTPAPSSKPESTAFKRLVPTAQFNPPASSSTQAALTSRPTGTPRHDPSRPNALVMPRPRTKSTLAQIVDVVVDPHISQYLRAHQREGVTFLYECVMGMRPSGLGALLADEMGLGKTLMTIALIWTLLKQNPAAGEVGGIARKVMIVCPVTLIGNWKREFRKWLGRERVAIFTLDDKSKKNVRDFARGRVYQVLLIGYERLQKIQAELKGVKFDLMVCDEGHRLKSWTNKTAQALRSVNCLRRILLTGTPIQNDLGEFYSMIDFVNPGLFENYNAFKKEFEIPILKSRQPEARKTDIEIGKARSEELSRLTKTFVLRRTADILSKYLPPKHEFVIFCKPTATQLDIYTQLLESKHMKSLIRSDDASNHLRAITALKKLCNSTSLLLSKSGSSGKKGAEDGDDDIGIVSSFLDDIDLSRARSSASTGSGKLVFLDAFLQQLYAKHDEKVVLVSSFTQTLDVLQDLLRSRGFSFLRLDGSTPMKKRQPMVDAFNREGKKESFAFLLSAKSGGAGINLIGASRLVLFDTDWNPSVDLQAMARIHRDGQTMPVHIYRLLTTGCIDEKIYQRQLTKQGLADNLMDGKSGSAENSFTMTELRDIFKLHVDTTCHTHDLLECKCDGAGTDVRQIKTEVIVDDESLSDDEDSDPGWMSASQLMQGKSALPKRLQSQGRLKALLDYTHIEPRKLMTFRDSSELSVIGDDVLQDVLAEGDVVSFVFRKIAAVEVNDDQAIEITDSSGSDESDSEDE
ncbi:SNF2 family N-terminal domain-containing protein [Myxozyma melibiosi]|uniref:SNF2 family N-terminal domain-containing protein n=1 Tax=Myxozyma melibiosi TaxID=54550 RepID=A0ABR1F334_9ASCO